MYDMLTYFAWFVLALLFAIAVTFIVWIGSLPGKIAVERKHPQVDAINALSWFGLLLGGVGWVLALVWALLRAEAWGAPAEARAGDPRLAELSDENRILHAKVAELEARLSRLEHPENEK